MKDLASATLVFIFAKVVSSITFSVSVFGKWTAAVLLYHEVFVITMATVEKTARIKKIFKYFIQQVDEYK